LSKPLKTDLQVEVDKTVTVLQDLQVEAVLIEDLLEGSKQNI
jgi:hypothetical protein